MRLKCICFLFSQPLYHGSPRALMFLNEPLESTFHRFLENQTKRIILFEGCSKVIPVASAGLFVEIKYHEPLFTVIQCLAECTLYGRGARIGGVHYSGDPSMIQSFLSSESID